VYICEDSEEREIELKRFLKQCIDAKYDMQYVLMKLPVLVSTIVVLMVNTCCLL
jgi:hypothetical protein